MAYNSNGIFTYNEEKYLFLAWKGDYTNLGAGAELGIYYGGSDMNSQWKVDESLAMEMTLTLTHKKNGIIVNQWNNWNEDTYWINSFNPKYQNVDASELTVTYTVRFKDGNMFMAFEKTEANGWSFNRTTATATLVF